MLCDSTFMRSLVRFIERKQSGGYQGLGEEGMGRYCLMGTVSIWENGKVILEMGGSDGCMTI